MGIQGPCEHWGGVWQVFMICWQREVFGGKRLLSWNLHDDWALSSKRRWEACSTQGSRNTLKCVIQMALKWQLFKTWLYPGVTGTKREKREGGLRWGWKWEGSGHEGPYNPECCVWSSLTCFQKQGHESSRWCATTENPANWQQGHFLRFKMETLHIYNLSF